MAKKILVVEDEKPLANALTLKLKGAGYTVDTAYNGDDALKALASGYDLMLMDIMMPKRDGWSVLEELKKNGPSVTVFVMSNLGQEEDMKRAKSLGAKEYFIKSETPLAKIVERVAGFLK